MDGFTSIGKEFTKEFTMVHTVIGLASLWQDFLKSETAEYQIPVSVRDAELFGLVMADVVLNHPEGVNPHSVLWETDVPQGTEDRTWYRTFLSLRGHRHYQDLLTVKNPDLGHCLDIINSFWHSSVFLDTLQN